MDEQSRQLAGLLEDMMDDFGAHNMNGNCCENISHGEFRALRVISRLDRCTMQDIAKSIAVTKGGATRIVSRLEEKTWCVECTIKMMHEYAVSNCQKKGNYYCQE